MTADDQHFLDVLSGISKDIRGFVESTSDAVDKHFETVAASIRDTLPEQTGWIRGKISEQTWIPQSIRGARPPPPTRITNPPAGALERAQSWANNHRALVAAVVAFAGTATFLVYRKRRRYNRKRRARRASNGARKEVVVLAGPPSSPITKSIALDLERRGFIVYIIAQTIEEEQTIQHEGRADIRPLHLDIVDPLGSRAAIERFNNILLSPHQAIAGTSPHNLRLAGVILVPDLIYTAGPIETVSPELWSDSLNAKVLNTIALTQAFLPTICDFKARVLLATPSIVSSLQPPFHGVENVIVAALEGFMTTLRQELGTLGIEVCHLKLGTFDSSGTNAKQLSHPISATRTYSWAPSARALYAENFVTQLRAAESRGLFSNGSCGAKGSSLRELNNAVFDALTQRNPKQTWRVGRGSVAYDIVGNWVPRTLVAYMLGIRKVTLQEISEPKLENSVQSWEKIDQSQV